MAVRNSGEMDAYFSSAWATYADGPLSTASLGGLWNNSGFFTPRWAERVASDGAEGERPHADVITAIELRETIATQWSLADRQATMKQIPDLGRRTCGRLVSPGR